MLQTISRREASAAASCVYVTPHPKLFQLLHPSGGLSAGLPGAGRGGAVFRLIIWAPEAPSVGKEGEGGVRNFEHQSETPQVQRILEVWLNMSTLPANRICWATVNAVKVNRGRHPGAEPHRFDYQLIESFGQSDEFCERG